MSEAMLKVINLKKYFAANSGLFKRNKKQVKAVDGVTISIDKGETFGLVGESGCGKSTTGRTIIRLYDVTEGEIIFDGQNVENLKNNEMKDFRKKIQMIFQDPYASLNSRMTVAEIVGEPLDIFKLKKGPEKQKKVFELLNKVGLSKKHANRYPHEFSGGQRQRVGIARALAVDPKMIICDEPISALDVSIQAQIVNTLQDLQEEMGLTYLFIAHDLSMVKYISDRIGVMYLGKLVEIAESEELYLKPTHPYTRALLSSIPVADPDKSNSKKKIILEGSVPSPINPPNGCRFNTRCKYAEKICFIKEPELVEISKNHMVACHLINKI